MKQVELSRKQDPQTELWGFTNPEGEWAIQPEYGYVEPFSEGLAKVRDSDNETVRWGFINREGVKVIPLTYGYVRSFRNSMAMVRDKDTKLFGFINLDGVEIIPFVYKSHIIKCKMSKNGDYLTIIDG